MVPTKFLFILTNYRIKQILSNFSKELATLHGNRIEGLDYVQSVNILVLWLNVHSVEITIITLMLTNLLKNFVKLAWIKYWLAFTKYFSIESKFLGFSTLWCSKTRNTWKKISWNHFWFLISRNLLTKQTKHDFYIVFTLYFWNILM